MKQLVKGDKCPHFDLPVWDPEAEQESRVSLQQQQGARFVLVFYPKDATPGCTTQACDLRDGWQRLKDRVSLFGVSPDDVKSHQRFASKQSLPYPLIADTGQELARAFGVWVEKKMYGKTFMGIQRSTFVVGPDGRIEASLPKVKPKSHLDDLQRLLDQLEDGEIS